MDIMPGLPVREMHAAAPDGDAASAPGTFTAIVSTFDHVVEQFSGPRILKKGCFERSLRERGLPRLIWSHEWGRIPLGVTHSARETDEGLEVTATFNLDDPHARHVYWAMTTKNGDGRPLIEEFSIGFDVVNAAMETLDGVDVTAVTDVDLFEFGPCLVGANKTRLIEVMSAGPPATGVTHEVAAAAAAVRPHQGGNRDARILRELLTARPR